LLTRVYEESKFFLVLSHELEHTFRDRVRHDANHHMNFLLLSHWDQLMVMIISMCATPRPRRRALCNCQGARGPAPWVPDAAMGDAGRRPFADAKSKGCLFQSREGSDRSTLLGHALRVSLERR